MPYYNDVPYYYGGTFVNHSSLMTGTGRPFAPLSRFSPHLSTISESPFNLHRFSPIATRHTRRVIDTADIDVSSPRVLSHDGNRPRNRLRRDRPTIKIRSQALKDNPTLRQHNEKHEKSVGELLMEKFLIKDKRSDGESKPERARLHHQVSLDGDERELETIRKQVTRRFTRRRSSADLQLDSEQLQREATYARVQAKVLDSLVAEEQATIQNEARRGTLIRRATARGPAPTHRANNTDSDATTEEEEEEEEGEEGEDGEGEGEAAAPRMRKAMKRAKRKKRWSDEPSPPDNGRSSQVSVDSNIDEKEAEENSPRPQMYRIEACNSAGDFSTIWVNASESERRKPTIGEQPSDETAEVLGEFGGSTGNAADAGPPYEMETRIVLPARRPYVTDPSRYSVHLTMRSVPTVERLNEKLDVENDSERDESRRRLTNGFAVDARSEAPSDDIPCYDATREDTLELNGEMCTASGRTAAAKTNALSGDNDGSCGKRSAAISRIKSEGAREAPTRNAPSSPSLRNAGINSTESDASTNKTRATRSGLSQATLATNLKRNESVARESPEAASSVRTPQAPVTLRTNEHGNEVEEATNGSPRTLATSPRRSVVASTAGVAASDAASDAAGENSASSALPSTLPCATRLPKLSKINVDRNNAVEAPELSLRAAAYLASSPRRSERAREDVGAAALPPGKKADEASNLARNDGVPGVSVGEASGVRASKSMILENLHESTTAKPAIGRVRSDDRVTTRSPKDFDFESRKDVGAETPRNEKAKGVISRKLSSLSSPKNETEADVAGRSTSEEGSVLSRSLEADARKIVGAIDPEKDPPRDSGLSSPKGQASELGGADTRFLFKVKTLPKKTSDPGAPKRVGNDDSETAAATPRKDAEADAPRLLKRSVPVPDSSRSANDRSPLNLPSSRTKVERATDKKRPVKGTAGECAGKVTEKKLATVDASCEGGQLSKSASTESIDFWSEINRASDSPEATSATQRTLDGRRDSGETAAAVAPKIEGKPTAGSTSPKRTSSSDSPTAPIKEVDDKRNETDVKIGVAPRGGSALGGSSDVAAERVPRMRARATKAPQVERSGTLTVQRAPRKKKSPLIDQGLAKESSVKRTPLKPRDDFTSSIVQSDASGAATWTSTSEPSTLPRAVGIAVPMINVIEASTGIGLPEPERQSADEEDPSTPTNEPIDSTLITKISKWSNRNDLTNADDAETPVPSEETSLAASPTVSPQSSKNARRVVRKKKLSAKKTPSSRCEKESTRGTGNVESTSRQNAPAVEAVDKQLLQAKPSPKSSPRNSPSQRPLDLIRMFYTTPSALLTATPRDLSKVRRAKIKRRRHHSRTPSVSSDSTGSTTSTATAESTADGSAGSTCTELDDDPEHKRMNSTRSNDSGFDGSPRILNCDMACHKKCERLTGNLCGLNQKLVAEALQALKRAPSQSSDSQRNSDPSDHFSSGRITPPATNLPRFKKYAVTDFHFLKVLGKGSFGKVLLAELHGTECVYAVKCLKKDVVLEDDDVECTLIERKVLTLATRHPYLCHLFCTFQTDSHLFFVMEYLNGGDLMFHIQKSGRFPEVRARFYAAEIWSGLNFLHKKGIVYRDLKLDNVLLDFEGHIRIADFGMCKLQIFLDRTADTFCGTPDYMAPEIIKGLKYNQAVDWWSYGILLYEMLTGQSPFSGCDEDELFWSICNERPFIPRYLSQEATDILVCLLEKDSGKRPPGHEIAMHAFFQSLPWDRLERRQLEPPFKPTLDHTLDTKYFDTAFTTERPRLTPVPEQILVSMDQGVFRGFSYTNPNATD